MKKLLLTLSFACLLAFGLSSCSKDDNGGLAGTTWVERGSFYTETFRFTTNTDVVLEWEEDDYRDFYYGTYTYNEPNITITMRGEDGDTYRTTGIVNDNTLKIDDGYGGYDVYYRKQ
ncbi:MAG: hypothetical protein LBM20_08805 [Rikenellaceae bacterium]|nr:hypothetical protein [Rikenellaceae bacterium]